MAINQLSTANTFEQWLIATQSLIAFANSITDAGSGGTFTSNTSEYIITGNLTVGNTVTCVTMNTDVIIFNDGTRLTSNVQIVNAYNHANGGFNHANAAFNKANSANVLAQQAYDYANTISTSAGELSGNNVTATKTVTGNNIVANVSISTNTFTANVVTIANSTTTNVLVVNTSITTNTLSGNSISLINTLTTDNVTANLVTAIDINTTSDISLKNNLQQITNPLDVIDQITGFSFNWKFDGSKSYGLSAQEIEQILPEIVKQRSDGVKGVNYLNLIAFLIEAVKQLNRELSEVKININKK